MLAAGRGRDDTPALISVSLRDRCANTGLRRGLFLGRRFQFILNHALLHHCRDGSRFLLGWRLEIFNDGLVRIEEAEPIHLDFDFFDGLRHLEGRVVLLGLPVLLLGHIDVENLIDKLTLLRLEAMRLLILVEELVGLGDSPGQDLPNGRVIVNLELQAKMQTKGNYLQ